MPLNMARKLEKLFYMILVLLHLQKEYTCYQLTGIFGCRDIYIWMTEGSVSCKYLTHPSRHLIHMNPKFYCTEYSLTRCCETCTILERHNYRILNGVHKQMTTMPTTAVDLFTRGMTEATQETSPLKTFFTIPVVQTQDQTTVSQLTRLTANIMSGTDSVLNHTRTTLSIPVATVKTQMLPIITQTVLHRQNNDRTVKQLFTLPPEIRQSNKTFTLPLEIPQSDKTSPAMITVKYSDTSAADVNIPTTEPTPPPVTYKTVSPTHTTRELTQKTIQQYSRTTTTPAVTTTTTPATTTTTTPATTTTTTPAATTTTTPVATTTHAATTKTSKITITTTTSPTITTHLTAKPAQEEIIKPGCTDIGIWIVAGSVPCDYLVRDNEYGLNKNQLYFCNRYPLTSCCETCERINRSAVI